MADYLNTIRMYRDVKITRDYSVVHDLTPAAWLTYLKTLTAVFSGGVNYYRLPSVIRIEGNYDDLRKVTYGVLEGYSLPDIPPQMQIPTFERPYFFWVDEVRLIKQHVAEGGTLPNITAYDVVELVISPDVWSNCNGQFELYDSWIVRRHMDRWYDDNGTKKPEYYPDAADPVDGAMKAESAADMTPTVSYSLGGEEYTFNMRWIVVNVIKPSGEQAFYIGGDFLSLTPDTVPDDEKDGYISMVKLNNGGGGDLFQMQNVLDGSLFTEIGVSAENVQSITVLPELSKLREAVTLVSYSGGYGGTGYHALVEASNWNWEPYFTFSGTNVHYLTCSANSELGLLMKGLYRATSVSVSPSAPSWRDPVQYPAYTDSMEPMLYMAPARVRKIVNGMGGTVVDVPDIEAFRDMYTIQNLLDVSTAVTVVFGGADIVEANAVGNVGITEAATLPIYNSAWKSYEAINKVGDEIAYNAQQASTVANGLAGAAASGGMGAMAGGPIGAVLGAVTSLVGTGTQMYSNSENLRAKQTVIRNSPCTVKSSGSGMGAYVTNMIDLVYVVLKIDDVSLNKLRTQYYYYGYNVGEVAAGTVSLTTRKYFDYIETKGARVRGDLNAAEARQIAGIFDRGVRIYHGTDGYAQIGAGMGLENYEV